MSQGKHLEFYTERNQGCEITHIYTHSHIKCIHILYTHKYVHTYCMFATVIFEKDFFVYNMENGMELQKNIDKKISQKGMTIIQAKDSLDQNKDTRTERNGQIRKNTWEVALTLISDEYMGMEKKLEESADQTTEEQGDRQFHFGTFVIELFEKHPNINNQQGDI